MKRHEMGNRVHEVGSTSAAVAAGAHVNYVCISEPIQSFLDDWFGSGC